MCKVCTVFLGSPHGSPPSSYREGKNEGFFLWLPYISDFEGGQKEAGELKFKKNAWIFYFTVYTFFKKMDSNQITCPKLLYFVGLHNIKFIALNQRFSYFLSKIPSDFMVHFCKIAILFWHKSCIVPPVISFSAKEAMLFPPRSQLLLVLRLRRFSSPPWLEQLHKNEEKIMSKIRNKYVSYFTSNLLNLCCKRLITCKPIKWSNFNISER